MIRAQKLIKGLNQEKLSWTKKLEDFDLDLKLMIGDLVQCCGIIAYLGAFNLQYRIDCINHWKLMLDEF